MYFYCYLCVVFDPDSCKMGTGIFPGVKSGRGVLLNNHPLPVPWSRKSRAIPRLHLWAVRPVQSLSVCTRVHLTFLPLCVVFSFIVLFCVLFVRKCVLTTATGFKHNYS